MSPVWIQTIPALRSQDPEPLFSRVLVQNSRYTDDTLSFRSFVFPTAIYRALRLRPVPCNCYVIRQDVALSRR
jgi:hypothetical protein